DERRKVLGAWNDTALEFDHDARIDTLFEAQAARTPDAVAVAGDDRALTYRELNARANRLARYLRRLGVGRDVPVGIAVARGPELLVGLLGILKAGGAYVPLDPTYPRSRLGFMVEDAGMPVIVTQTHLAPQLPAHAARTVCLDAEWPEIAREDAADLDRRGASSDLAYIIYTSGSTGKPK